MRVSRLIEPFSSSNSGENWKRRVHTFSFSSLCLLTISTQINAFYLTKERDLRLRILTLLNNRKRLLVHLGRASSTGTSDIDDMTQGIVGGDLKKSAEWANLEEGWRLFEKDLGKLQQFVDINATGFRKILKKWDKRSKSSTKELYLQRQVEIQPCFNREVSFQACSG
jgi:CDK inhibitor PHO81